MKTLKYLDNMGNMATIEKTQVLPYQDAKTKQDAYILKCVSLYNDNFCYHLSVLESLQEAKQKLSRFSLGTFKQV